MGSESAGISTGDPGILHKHISHPEPALVLPEAGNLGARDVQALSSGSQSSPRVLSTQRNVLNSLNVLLEALRTGCHGQMRKLRLGQGWLSHSLLGPQFHVPQRCFSLRHSRPLSICLVFLSGWVYVGRWGPSCVTDWLLLSLSHLKHP